MKHPKLFLLAAVLLAAALPSAAQEIKTACGESTYEVSKNTPRMVAMRIALTKAREYLAATGRNLPIECEVRSLEDIDEVFAAGGAGTALRRYRCGVCGFSIELVLVSCFLRPSWRPCVVNKAYCRCSAAVPGLGSDVCSAGCFRRLSGRIG